MAFCTYCVVVLKVKSDNFINCQSKLDYAGTAKGLFYCYFHCVPVSDMTLGSCQEDPGFLLNSIRNSDAAEFLRVQGGTFTRATAP